VLVSEPAVTKTPILDQHRFGRRQFGTEPNPYEEAIKGIMVFLNSNKEIGQEPAVVAQHIVDAAVSTDATRFRIQHSQYAENFVGEILKDPKGLNIPPLPPKFH